MATVYCINAEGAMACRFWDAFPPIKALLPERQQRRGKMCKKSFNFASKQMLSLIYRDSVEYSPQWFQIQLLVTKWERHREKPLKNDHSKQVRQYCVTNQNDATHWNVTCYKTSVCVGVGGSVGGGF